MSTRENELRELNELAPEELQVIYDTYTKLDPETGSYPSIRELSAMFNLSRVDVHGVINYFERE